MAQRKTDFNTEDIMGSLLGRNEPVSRAPLPSPAVPAPLPADPEPEKRIRGKAPDRENKVPVSFSMTRSMADDLKHIAYVDRITASEIICELVAEYIRQHQTSLREYERISKR